MDLTSLCHTIEMDTTGIRFLADHAAVIVPLPVISPSVRPSSVQSIIRCWSEIDHAIRGYMTTVEISYADCLMMAVDTLGALKKSAHDNPLKATIAHLKKKHHVSYKFMLRKLVTLLLPRSSHEKRGFLETLGFTDDSFPHYSGPWWCEGNLISRSCNAVMMAMYETTPERLTIPITVDGDSESADV